MRFSFKAALAALVLAFVAPHAVSAQQAAPQLAVGTWTGAVTPPSAETTNVTFDVAMKNDSLSITINAAEHGTFTAFAIKVEAGKLSFSFTPGPTVQCVLNHKDDNSYAGTCLDEGGAEAQIVMIPPKKSAGS